MKRLFIAFVASCLALANPMMAENSASLTWKEFQDPSEHAFTLEVPEGWVVKGGLFRLGYSDARPMIDIQSPDGKTDVRIGDVAIPSYVVPNQFHSKEGDVYDLGQQAQLIVAKYRTGQEYARLYALARFTSVCKSLSPQQAVDSETLVSDYIPQEVAPIQSSAGQVCYACDSGPNGRIACAYAKTALFQGLWQVTTLGSFIVPTNQADTARAILRRATQSFRLVPAWKQYQAGMDAQGVQYQRARQQQRVQQLSQQVQAFESQMSAMRSQVSAFQRRQSAQADQVTSWGKTLTGLTPTTDPLNGATRDVWTGPNSGYWIDGQGNVANSGLSPGAGWRPLQPQ